MGAATSVNRRGSPQANGGAGNLPLPESLHPLHALNLAITEHHHRESVGDISLDNLSDEDIYSLIKAYTAHHVALDSEQEGISQSIAESKEELARKSMELSRYLNRLALAIVTNNHNAAVTGAKTDAVNEAN